MLCVKLLLSDIDIGSSILPRGGRLIHFTVRVNIRKFYVN